MGMVLGNWSSIKFSNVLMHETSMEYLSLETLGCCITRTQGGKGYFVFTGFWDFCDH
jgi:hypothetical protein